MAYADPRRRAERCVTAAEAFLLQLLKQGLEGHEAAGRSILTALEEIKKSANTRQDFSVVIIRTILVPGSVTSALEPLRMAKKLDPFRETARMALEPWLVEAALSHLDQVFSPAEQRTIVKATRTPPQGPVARLVERTPLTSRECFGGFWRFDNIIEPLTTSGDRADKARPVPRKCHDSSFALPAGGCKLRRKCGVRNR